MAALVLIGRLNDRHEVEYGEALAPEPGDIGPRHRRNPPRRVEVYGRIGAQLKLEQPQILDLVCRNRRVSGVSQARKRTRLG